MSEKPEPITHEEWELLRSKRLEVDLYCLNRKMETGKPFGILELVAEFAEEAGEKLNQEQLKSKRRNLYSAFETRKPSRELFDKIMKLVGES